MSKSRLALRSVTKSGSNRFEGSLNAYVSSSGLVGRDPDRTRGGDFLAQDVALTLGGPVVRDRAAFFLETGAVHVELPQHLAVIGRDTAGGRDSLDVGIRRASAERSSTHSGGNACVCASTTSGGASSAIALRSHSEQEDSDGEEEHQENGDRHEDDRAGHAARMPGSTSRVVR